MAEYLILRLQGVMQAWGRHTFEDYRPIESFPTRSGVVGLLGGCLGIDRQDIAQREHLSNSISMAVRMDQRHCSPIMMTDFHTVLKARMAKGNDKSNKNAVMSYREYQCDAHFTIALGLKQHSFYSLDQLECALKAPQYTPVLGRRSCPITAPLFQQRMVTENAVQALAAISPFAGTIYSEEGEDGVPRIRVRDVPMKSPHRQFATRDLYVIQQESAHGSE